MPTRALVTVERVSGARLSSAQPRLLLLLSRSDRSTGGGGADRWRERKETRVGRLQEAGEGRSRNRQWAQPPGTGQRMQGRLPPRAMGPAPRPTALGGAWSPASGPQHPLLHPLALGHRLFASLHLRAELCAPQGACSPALGPRQPPEAPTLLPCSLPFPGRAPQGQRSRAPFCCGHRPVPTPCPAQNACGRAKLCCPLQGAPGGEGKPLLHPHFERLLCAWGFLALGTRGAPSCPRAPKGPARGC